MKKNIRKFLTLLVALALIVSCVPAVQIRAEEQSGAQVWTDDFSSGKGDHYTPYGYWWNMDGQLTVGDLNAGAGVSYYWLNDYVWGDFVMEFDVINQTNQFGVILRAQNTTGNDCMNDGYGVLSDTAWAFFMAENGTWSGFDALVNGERWANPVDGYAWATQPGANNVHWKIVAKGNRIEVYFNNAETPSMAMDATLWSSGAIGFRTWNNGGETTAVVDNLTITEIVEEDKSDDTNTGVVWTDDFSSGKGGSYTPYGYWWNMDGVLTAGDPNAAAGVSYYWLNDHIWDDFVMEFDVVNQTNQFGVIFRAQNPTGADCQSQSYGILYDCNWAFFMAENGTFTTFDGLVDGARWANFVDGCAWAAQPGTQNVHWKIVAKGNRIEVYFNNAETPSMAMDATLYSSGVIGFRTWNNGGETTAVIDNLTITEIVDDDDSSNSGGEQTGDAIEAFGTTWEPYGGNWSLVDGGFEVVGDGSTVLPKLISTSDYRHFTIEADLVGLKNGGIVFRSGDPTVGADGFDGYFVGYDSAYAFFGKDIGGWVPMSNGAAEATAAAQLSYREKMHWKLVVSGNTFTLYVDDMEKPLIQTFDNTFTSAGGIGFRAYAENGEEAGRFENVVITTIAEEDAVYTTEGTYDLWAKRLVNQYPAAENQNKVILIGASHAEFWDTHEEDFAPLETLNFGMGGSWISHIADKTDMMLIPYNPKAVIVITGGNDLAGGTPANTVVQWMNDYLLTLTEDLPGVPIICTGLLTRLSDSASHRAMKVEINEAIGSFCDEHENLYFVGMDDCVGLVNGAANNELFLADNIHLNDAGYEQFGSELIPVVNEILDGTYEPDSDPDPDDAPDEPTQPEDNKPAQTWEDDFSSDKGGSYIPHGYWWNMDGQLTVGDTNAMAGVCYYWLKDMVWGDFVMEFDVLQQSSEFGVIIRAQDTSANDCQNQGYGILYDTDWAFFMVENGSFTTFDQLVEAGQASKVGDHAWACQPGSTENVHWKIVADGDVISVYFNHSETPSMVMKSDLWDSGVIGFRTNNPGGAITAVVDNLTITEIGNPDTGDSTNMMVVILVGISAAALVVLLLNKRRFQF